jgi:transposase
LQGLVRRREAVLEMLTQEKNRLAAGGLIPAVDASLRGHIAVLEASVADLDAAITRHVDTHPGLRQQRDLLVTIPGIGLTTAARLLAECRAITDFDSARLCGVCWLSAREAQSGTLRGRSRCRSSILATPSRPVFPALTALRHNPPLVAFAARLAAAGKHKMVIVGAVMRKLLHQADGVLKHQRAFDPELA